MCYIMIMSSSITVTFSGKSSVLQSYFLPEIILDADCDYSCALLDLYIKNKNEADLRRIVELSVVRINCDIISGSYINGERSQTIHQFATSTSVVKGHKAVKKQSGASEVSLDVKDQTFVEIPKHLNYFPIKSKNLSSIRISIVNQDGNLVDIDGAYIICRINIKRDINEKKSA